MTTPPLSVEEIAQMEIICYALNWNSKQLLKRALADLSASRAERAELARLLHEAQSREDALVAAFRSWFVPGVTILTIDMIVDGALTGQVLNPLVAEPVDKWLYDAMYAIVAAVEQRKEKADE